MAAMTIQTEATGLMARETAALSLAAAFSPPGSSLSGAFRTGDNAPAIRGAWNYLEVLCMENGGDASFPAADMDSLCRWISMDADRRATAHREVFGLIASRECSPYSTDYIPWDFSAHRAQALADIAGYYRAFGLAPDPGCPERPDHVSLELEFTAFLLAKVRHAQGNEEHVDICSDALRSFFSNHPLWWMPAFAKCFERRAKLLSNGSAGICADIKEYLAAGRLLRGWLAAEMTLLAAEPPQRPVALPAPGALPPEPEPLDCSSCPAAAGEAQGEGAQ